MNEKCNILKFKFFESGHVSVRYRTFTFNLGIKMNRIVDLEQMLQILDAFETESNL